MNTYDTVDTALARLITMAAGRPTSKPLPSFEISEQWRDKWLKIKITHPDLLKAALFIERWCKQVRRNLDPDYGKQLLLLGVTGTGKTHLLKSAKRYVEIVSIDAWSQGFWGNPIKSSYIDSKHLSDVSDDCFYAVLSEVEESDCVFVEDLGSETDVFRGSKPTERVRKVFEAIGNKWVIVTSNVTQDQWESRWDARVDSRLSKLCLLDFSAVPDYRRKK